MYIMHILGDEQSRNDFDTWAKHIINTELAEYPKYYHFVSSINMDSFGLKWFKTNIYNEYLVMMIKLTYGISVIQCINVE